jgi:hypothetical protein
MHLLKKVITTGVGDSSPWSIVKPRKPPFYKAIVLGKNQKIMGTSCVIKQLARVNFLGRIYKNLPL